MGDRLEGPPTNDDLIFAPEQPSAADAPRGAPWKVLIVDDEKEIHSLTRLVLEGFTFEGRELDLLNAHSGAQAKEMAQQHPDLALILLDVVMEDHDSGLQVVRYIREELENRFVRIVLRTGQPGQAPEHEVVTNYDINDYKAKTELTAQKLYTTVTSALRAHRDLRTIERHSEGLERILEASGALFDVRGRAQFAEVVLRELDGILLAARAGQECDGTGAQRCSGLVALPTGDDFRVIRGTGRFAEATGEDSRGVLPDDVRRELAQVAAERSNAFVGDHFLAHFHSDTGREKLLYFQAVTPLSPLERKLVRVFANHATVAFRNLALTQEIVDTQKEVIATLGELVETRSQEMANHTHRVGEFARLLGRLAGLAEAEADLLQLAAPMHDVGKVGVPDSILNKPGAVTPEEFEVIKSHTTIGHEILGKSSRKIMQAAAVVAHQHHERWDGQGYPQGLAGESVHLFGRITCLVDVFDALGHRRCYKEPWPLERILEFVRDERGKLFDPRLVDLFLDHLDEFLTIADQYADE